MGMNKVGLETSGFAGGGVGKPEIGQSAGPREYDGIDVRDRLVAERYHPDLMAALHQTARPPFATWTEPAQPNMTIRLAATETLLFQSFFFVNSLN